MIQSLLTEFIPFTVFNKCRILASTVQEMQMSRINKISKY